MSETTGKDRRNPLLEPQTLEEVRESLRYHGMLNPLDCNPKRLEAMGEIIAKAILDRGLQTSEAKPAPSPAAVTLRDHFAGLALAAMIAEPVSDQRTVVSLIGPNTSDYPRKFATAAYSLADAMLKARGNG